jgi:hypothetical protein
MPAVLYAKQKTGSGRDAFSLCDKSPFNFWWRIIERRSRFVDQGTTENDTTALAVISSGKVYQWVKPEH